MAEPLLSFWPPKSPAIIAWSLVWTMTCLGTGIAIVRRARYAPSLVWGLIVLASYSAISAFRSGLLGAVEILIDVLLFTALRTKPSMTIWKSIAHRPHSKPSSATRRLSVSIWFQNRESDRFWPLLRQRSQPGGSWNSGPEPVHGTAWLLTGMDAASTLETVDTDRQMESEFFGLVGIQRGKPTA